MVGETNNAQEKGNKKGKDKRNTKLEPNKKFDPSDGDPGSKKDKHHRFDKGKCFYCNKGNHTEKGCVKKTIDKMSRILEKQDISLPKGAWKDESGDKTKYHERFHGLKVGFSKSHAFLIVSRASNHMVSTRESFSSLQLIDGPSIHMGDDTQIQAEGKGSIKLKHGVFKNLLYVPSLVANLLSIY